MAYQTGETGNPKAQKIWRNAILRSLDRRSKDKIDLVELDLCADALLDACKEKDIVALKELGDRLDGKPKQAIVGGEEDDPPIRVIHEADQSIIDRYMKGKQ